MSIPRLRHAVTAVSMISSRTAGFSEQHLADDAREIYMSLAEKLGHKRGNSAREGEMFEPVEMRENEGM